MVLKPLTKQEITAAPYLIQFVAKNGERYPSIVAECAVKYPEYFEEKK